MAQIDLKKATVKIWDGTVNGSTAANAGAEILGATDLDVGVGEGALFIEGQYFTIAGDTTRYYITVVATDNISFTPGLAIVLAGAEVITPSDCEEITIKIGEGNLTYSESRNMEYIRDRGLLDIVREGDEEPVAVTLDAVWEFITASSGESPTVEDALKARGEASAWITTGGACEPYALDVVILYEPDCSPTEDEQIVLREFRYESVDHDLRAGTLSMSGNCNVVEADVFRYGP